jgi:hypothetical protein
VVELHQFCAQIALAGIAPGHRAPEPVASLEPSGSRVCVDQLAPHRAALYHHLQRALGFVEAGFAPLGRIDPREPDPAIRLVVQIRTA